MKNCLSILGSLCVAAGVFTCDTARAEPDAGLASDPVVRCAEAKALLSALDYSGSGPQGLKLRVGRKELFFDDHAVARLLNVERRLHQPVKQGAIIRPDQPWEQGSIEIRSGPVWSREDKVWKMWYFGGREGLKLYATSEDGLHWRKPSLGRVEVGGSKQNNVISVDPSIKWPHNAMLNLIYDPDDPDASRRYKGFLGASGRRPIVSANGVDWHLLQTPQLPSSDESHLFYDQTNHLYLATLKQPGPYGRSVYLALSRDFEHWADPRDCLIFHADRRDQELGASLVQEHVNSVELLKPVINRPEQYQTDIYNQPVFSYEGLYLGMPTVFNHSGNTVDNSDGFSMAELAVSRDLIHWGRVGNRRKFLPLSAVEGGRNYDTGQLLAANLPLKQQNELWFFYSGLRWRAHPDYLVNQKYVDHPDAGAICMAKLRVDGFVSLDAGAQEGSVLTKPFVISGTSLHVNVDAPAGVVKAEILDANGNSLRGFGRNHSVAVRGDRVDADLRWRHAAVSALAGKVVQIRFLVRDAALYAFWLVK